MKTILFVILDKYADFEAAYLSSAIYLLGGNNYEVKTVSLKKKIIKSIGGFKTVPDFEIDLAPNNFEALILIGGMSWRNESSKEVQKLVDKCLDEEKILGAICDATVFLGSMSVLNNVYHTSNDLNDLKTYAGKFYTGEHKYIMRQAVSDKNIITANGTAPLEFAKEVLLKVGIAPEEDIYEWYNFHKLGSYTVPLPIQNY